MCETNPKYGPLAHLIEKPFDAELLVVETDYSDKEDENDTAVCKILNQNNEKVLVYFYGEILPEVNNVISVKGLKLRSPANSPPEYAYYNDYLKGKGIRYTAFVGEKYYKITNENGGVFPANKARQFNKFLNEKIQETFTAPRTSAFLRGLLLGDKDGFNDSDYTAFKSSGSVHIVSVSGFHVMLLLGILGIFLKKLPKLFADIITILFLVFLILVTGCTPSVIRASVMVMIAIASIYIRRDANTENALYIIAICLIISNRYIINNVSFVLSFSATYGIIKCSAPLNRLLSFIPSFIRGPAVASVSAQLGVLPAMIFYFGTISMYSLIPNILISFVVPVIFALAPITLITGFEPLIWVCNFICNLLFNMAHWVSSLPFNTLAVEKNSVLVIASVILTFSVCNILNIMYIKRKQKQLKRSQETWRLLKTI